VVLRRGVGPGRLHVPSCSSGLIATTLVGRKRGERFANGETDG
jgi:hypothetical protein